MRNAAASAFQLRVKMKYRPNSAGVIFTAAAMPVSTPVGRYLRFGESHHRSVSTSAMSTMLTWPWWKVLWIGSTQNASGSATSAHLPASSMWHLRSVSVITHQSAASDTSENSTKPTVSPNSVSGVKNSSDDGGYEYGRSPAVPVLIRDS